MFMNQNRYSKNKFNIKNQTSEMAVEPILPESDLPVWFCWTNGSQLLISATLASSDRAVSL